MRAPPMYICPDCEGHLTIMYAGRVITKRCSECVNLRRTAKTGADRHVTKLETICLPSGTEVKATLRATYKDQSDLWRRRQ